MDGGKILVAMRIECVCVYGALCVDTVKAACM